MKHLLRGLLVLILLSGLCFQVAGTIPTDSTLQDTDFPSVTELAPMVTTGEEGYQLVSEDGELQLLLDEADLKIAIKNKKSGMLWESTPSNVDQDPLAAEDTITAMHDLIRVSYFADSTMANSLGSYAECVQKKQYQLYTLENGFVAVLTLGEESGALLNPKVLSVDTFENTILPALSENERAVSRLKYLYKRRSISDYSDDRKAEMLKKYPTLADNDLYIANALNKSAQKEVDGYLKEAGFTLEQMESEYTKLQYQSDEKVEPSFEIPLYFILENGTLRVRIDTDNIVYDQDHFYLSQITLLPYFGAAGVDEDGYLLFPDGSGSLVSFNKDKKTSQLNIMGKVYGADMSVAEDTNIDIQCPLPIFGIHRGDQSMLGIITQGDADAYIQVENGNILHSYAAICSVFGVHYNISQDFYGSDSGVMQKEKRPYLGKKLEITYHFLSGENADLAGMAEVVREMLVERGMKQQLTDQDLPLCLETLGALETSENKLPWDKSMHPLTTYAQSGSIVEDMNKANIKNVQMRMKAIANGGLNNYAYSSVRLEKVLGSKSELKEFIAQAAEAGTIIYPDICLSYTMREKMLDGFQAARDTARTINGRITMMRETDMVLGIVEDSENIMMMNAKAAANYYPRIESFLNEVGSQGVSLGDIGRYVNTDFSKKSRMTRNESAEQYAKILSNIDGKVMVNYGNAYALSSADIVLNMPVTDKELINSCSESVPFIQMVCSGSIEYATDCINEQGDMSTALLKCIEVGASPYFVVAYDNLIYLRENEVGQQHCHVGYHSLKQEIIDGYHYVADALKDVRGSRIVSYKRVNSHLTSTGYSNGITILVNYADEPAQYQDVMVAARSYAVVHTNN